MLVLPTTVLVILTILFRLQAKTWIAPAPIFAAYWTVSIVFPLLFAPSDYLVSPSAIWWIDASVLCLGIGSMVSRISKRELPDTHEINEFTNYKLRNINRIVLFFSFLGILGAVYYVQQLGYGLGIFFSIDTLTNVASSVSESRYIKRSNPPALYTLLLCFTYAACYLGGMLRSLRATKIAFIPFIPIILTASVNTTKALIIFPVFLWIAGWLSMRVRLGKLNIPARLFLQLSIVGIFLTGIFVWLSMLRYQMFSLSGLKFIFDRLTVYYVGYLAGFSEWFVSSAYAINNIGMGAFTFAGVFDVLGIKARSAGIFTEGVSVGDSGTNIFTIFRYLIEDLTLPGSLVYLFLIGIIAGKAFESTRRGSFVALPILAMFYLQVLFSNTTTVYGYNTMIASSLIIFIYITLKQTKFPKVILGNKSS
ncbi:O-antigen polymerase [Niallia endozanthoxylica]|uniref:Oligosaccharide repeat unit polymerase n=1 Tax=Niallia endozanthoxylica TaxID=2036016 RepID=A0A5J5GZM5_9BACI|nr:O-antigen polymerase [Niallia endozanthoxylica]KAA9013819.1 oligosaccharide repeat unit polymerase [Niallia endozanthoxylica]